MLYHIAISKMAEAAGIGAQGFDETEMTTTKSMNNNNVIESGEAEGTALKPFAREGLARSPLGRR